MHACMQPSMYISFISFLLPIVVFSLPHACTHSANARAQHQYHHCHLIQPHPGEARIQMHTSAFPLMSIQYNCMHLHHSNTIMTTTDNYATGKSKRRYVFFLFFPFCLLTATTDPYTHLMTTCILSTFDFSSSDRSSLTLMHLHCELK